MDRWTELALVAHEVGGALTPARNAIHLLKEDLPAGMGSRQRRLMDMVARGLERADRVLGNLSCIALPESYTFQIEAWPPRENLAEWVAGFEEEASARKLCLEVRTAEDAPAIPVDRFLLEQVLGNLLSNALKFTPSGGKVVVSAEVPRGVVLPGRMLLLAGGFGFRPRFVQISVEDTGIGLTEETRRRLFQPFFRGQEAAQHSGTGLGLTVAQRLVRMLHGDLRAESKGEGTRFLLTLPADPSTLELARNVDALYARLQEDLSANTQSVVVLRYPGSEDDSMASVQEALRERLQVEIKPISPTTWITWSSHPVRELFDAVSAAIRTLPHARRREVCVQARHAPRGSQVDQLVLQTVVRCLRSLPETFIEGSETANNTEVLHGADTDR